MYNPVSFNPLKTRDDFEQAAMQLLEPLVPKLSKGCARLHLGDTGAVYPDSIAEMEAYSRPLWALVPMMMGGCRCALPLWEKWMRGLENGTDPQHPEYWGDIGPFDQRMVEMAVMGMAMCLIPKPFFFDRPKAAQDNIHRWLMQINDFDMPKNNWLFFRVLVNIGFQLNDLPYDPAMLQSDLDMIETHYESNGWYYDYPTQREYYTMWAFHYYGLIYARAMERRDPERSKTFRERAKLMEKQFEAWFAADGEALPYGRSLSYRFAQSAFFSAMPLGDPDATDVDWGVAKGLLLRNCRKWFSRPIFTQDGVLAIGYGYPSLLMAEGYNAPGSPYWAMKVFAALALPASHPFWACEEKPHCPPERLLDQHARMLILRDPAGKQVLSYTAGNHSEGHAHDDAKYEKFVYSTHFAFSVPKSPRILGRGAYDSMLALSDDGVTFHTRYGCESYSLTEERIESIYHPFADVRVQTTIIPIEEWHVRIHRIQTPRKLYVADGGFAINRDEGKGFAATETDGASACAYSSFGTSSIVGLLGYGHAEIVLTEPNTNLLYPRTFLPTLRAELGVGEHVLICAVLGSIQNGESNRMAPPKEVLRYAELG